MLSFKARKEDVASTLSRIARDLDAAILPQPDPNGSDTTGIIEAIRFGSGHPLDCRSLFARTPGSRDCAHCLGWWGTRSFRRGWCVAGPDTGSPCPDRHCRRPESEDAYPSGGTVIQCLAQHGIRAELRNLPNAVADALLFHAAYVGAGLIVLGIRPFPVSGNHARRHNP